jgi:hypothetical protein
MIGAQYPGAEHVHTLYKQYREYIVHEDNLINHRSTWIYMIQSFLVASYGFAIKLEGSDKLKPIFQRPDDTAAAAEHHQWFLVMVALVGILVGVIGILSLFGPKGAIDELQQKWEQEIAKTYPDCCRELPGLTGGGKQRNTFLGRLAPYFLPVVLIGMWFGLLFFSFRYWVP